MLSPPLLPASYGRFYAGVLIGTGRAVSGVVVENKIQKFARKAMHLKDTWLISKKKGIFGGLLRATVRPALYLGGRKSGPLPGVSFSRLASREAVSGLYRMIVKISLTLAE